MPLDEPETAADLRDALCALQEDILKAALKAPPASEVRGKLLFAAQIFHIESDSPGTANTEPDPICDILDRINALFDEPSADRQQLRRVRDKIEAALDLFNRDAA